MAKAKTALMFAACVLAVYGVTAALARKGYAVPVVGDYLPK